MSEEPAPRSLADVVRAIAAERAKLSPEEREAQDREWRIPKCAFGGHKLAPDAPAVWVGSVSREMACLPCFDKRVASRAAQYGWTVEQAAADLRWRGVDREWGNEPLPHAVHPCGACGRMVTAVNAYWHGWCTPECGQRGRDRARQLGLPEPRQCEVCGEMFTPKHRNGQYHNAAHKQKAYRMHKAGLPLPFASRQPPEQGASGNTSATVAEVGDGVTDQATSPGMPSGDPDHPDD